MKIIVETERCYLRELSVDDAPSLFALNADADVVKYTGDKAFEDIQEAKSFLQNYNQYELYGFGRWAVIDKKNKAFLGWCGLKCSPELNEVDLGFRFFKKYWNQGYATEGAQASLAYAFNQCALREIVSFTVPSNLRSIKVMEKIGLKRDLKGDFAHPKLEIEPI